MFSFQFDFTLGNTVYIMYVLFPVYWQSFKTCGTILYMKMDDIDNDAYLIQLCDFIFS